MVRKSYQVIIDRPMGFRDHFGNTYPVNYGYIPELLAGDSEEQDVYVISQQISQPLQTFWRELVAIIHRENDVQDKWVLTSPGENLIFSHRLILSNNTLHQALRC